MRIRIFLALASVSFVAVGLAVQACGGTAADETTPKADASVADTSTGPAAKDATTDTADAAAPCDPKKDFLATIPDASIADGASSTGVCIGCVKSKCGANVAKCAADCVCQGVAGAALECFAKGQPITTCGAGLFGVPQATQTIGIGLFSCVQQSCKDECAAASFVDGGDGG